MVPFRKDYGNFKRKSIAKSDWNNQEGRIEINVKEEETLYEKVTHKQNSFNLKILL